LQLNIFAFGELRYKKIGQEVESEGSFVGEYVNQP